MAQPPPEPSPVTLAPVRHGLLPPGLRRDLADLNAQYLELATTADRAADPRFGWSEEIRLSLQGLDADIRVRMAAAPFALFRLVLPAVPPPLATPCGVADLPRPLPGAGWQPRCDSFVHQVAFFARRLVDGAPLSAHLVLDLTPEAQVMLGQLCPSQLASLAANPGLVRPRWPGHLRYWEMLAAAARRASPEALQWAHCVGVCLLGAEDGPAAPDPRNGPRRHPRR
jgi:hypothetical protein